MGRIKSLMVKRAARQLINATPESFNSEFNHNKKMLGSRLPSKPIRNKVAGYIARLQRMKAAQKSIKAE